MEAAYDKGVSTIALLRPTSGFAMHYDAPEHARFFVPSIEETVSVRTFGDMTPTLMRATLPGAREMSILGYRGDRR